MTIPPAFPAYLPRLVLLHPGDAALTVARRLVRRGVEVHALTDRRHAHVLASRGVRGQVLPSIADRPDVWAAELDALAARGGGVVLSGSDAATDWLARSRVELDPQLWTFESKDGVHLALMNRVELHRLAREAGVRTPGLWHVGSRSDLARIRAGIPFPCLVQPALAHVAEPALGAGTVRVGSLAELDAAACALLDRHLDLVVTELVPGPDSAVEGAVTVRDRDGHYLLEYGMRTVRRWPPGGGAGSLVACADVPETLALNRRLLDHVGFHGLSGCTTMRHAGTGELYLVDVDVRMPAGFGLAEACGADGAWRLYAALAGLPMAAAPRPRAGRKVVLRRDLLAAWRQVRARPRSLPRVLRSWRGVRASGVLSLHDPGPALALVRSRLAVVRDGRRPAALR